MIKDDLILSLLLMLLFLGGIIVAIICQYIYPPLVALWFWIVVAFAFLLIADFCWAIELILEKLEFRKKPKK